jgi:hypothetical protein
MGVGKKVLNDVKPYMMMILLQIGYAGMYIVSVASLKRGMSHYVLVTYRNLVATLVMLPFALIFEKYVLLLPSTNLSISTLLLRPPPSNLLACACMSNCLPPSACTLSEKRVLHACMHACTRTRGRVASTECFRSPVRFCFISCKCSYYYHQPKTKLNGYQYYLFVPVASSFNQSLRNQALDAQLHTGARHQERKPIAS